MTERTHYVTNAMLLEAIREAKAQGKLTNRLASYIQLIAENFSRKPNWSGYSWREDMVSAAVVNLCANWHKFDETKYEKPNPFSFYTTAIYRSFLLYIELERQLRFVKDTILMEHGMDPSFSFEEEMEAA